MRYFGESKSQFFPANWRRFSPLCAIWSHRAPTNLARWTTTGLNADKTVCHTYERYRNSDAVIAHATTFGRSFAERFLQTCRQIGLDVYGAPNDAAKALLDQYGASYYSKVAKVRNA
jgi:hypothetical protein